jgi:Cu+-exporting ATPase
MTSTLVLTIEGMHCGSCALLIDDALADVPGVLSANTSSKHRRATIVHDNRATRAHLIAAIADLGYDATPAGQAAQQH